MHKGDKVCVFGELFLQEYVDKQGVKRTSLDVTAQDVEFMWTRPWPQDNTDESMPAGRMPEEEDLPF